MLFTWEYFLFLSASVIVYYLFFTKKPYLYLNTLSFLFIAFWHIPSAITAAILTGLTILVTSRYNSKSSRISVIILHLLCIFLLRENFINDSLGLIKQALTILGVSYYSLQNISILTTEKTPKNSQKLILSNLFFVKFFAGPILLPKESEKTRPATSFDENNITNGVQRILLGFGKKIILADRLSPIVNNLFNSDPSTQNLFSISIGSVLFTLQMYLDFSAYSDIAVGSARLFGMSLKENFNLPIGSTSISQYWRKTHMSLIDWLTVHVYYPTVYWLRKNTVFSVVTAFTFTFILSALWHGTHVGFLIWGILNATYLITEYLRNKYKPRNTNPVLGWALTFTLVSFSNFFFRAQSGKKIIKIYHNITHNNFFPENWMTDFIALIGNGGHLLQQYNLIETASLVLVFFILEKPIDKKAKSLKASFTYLFISLLLLFFFGNFNAGDEFIYVQF